MRLNATLQSGNRDGKLADSVPNSNPGMQLPVTDPFEYREVTERYTVRAVEMISEELSNADFKSDFPHIFGDPSKIGPKVQFRNDCGLLLHKALLHAKAAVAANHQDNLHSVAVQLRVVLECAARLQAIANVMGPRKSSAVNQLHNAIEYDFANTTRILARNESANEGISRVILGVRREFGNQSKKPPTRVVIRDLLSNLKDGPELYDFITDHFCKCRGDSLVRPSTLGGVIRPPREFESFAFGNFFEFLAGTLLFMFLSYGLLLSSVDGDSRVFDDAADLLDKKRSACRALMSNNC